MKSALLWISDFQHFEVQGTWYGLPRVRQHGCVVPSLLQAVYSSQLLRPSLPISVYETAQSVPEGCLRDTFNTQWRWPDSHTTRQGTLSTPAGQSSTASSICMEPIHSPSERCTVPPSNGYFSIIWEVLALAWRETFTFHMGRKSIPCIIPVLLIQRAKSKVNWFPEAEQTFGVSTDTVTIKEQTFQFSSSVVDVNKIAHEANCSQLFSALRTIMFFGNDHLC